jgi:hypothetical protein
MEDDAEVKKAIDEAQGIYDVHGKQEWVELAGKMLMPHMHVQMAMERADVARAEQEALDKERQQAERAQREAEWAVKEAELEEREMGYIWQVDAVMLHINLTSEPLTMCQSSL